MIRRKESPAHIRGSECMIVRAAVNLWLWSDIVENSKDKSAGLPEGCTYWVYPKDLELGGPQLLNGKRVKVTFQIEDD
jgi:hypothetical protein